MKGMYSLMLALSVACFLLVPVRAETANTGETNNTDIGEAIKREDGLADGQEPAAPLSGYAGEASNQEGEISLSHYEAAGLSEAVSGRVNDTIEWRLSVNGVLTISGTGAMPDLQTTDEVPWSAYRSCITNVIVDEGITKIGEASFYKCWYLETADIAASVVEIGAGAFADTIISTVTGMENTAVFGDYVFQGSEFTRFTFPAATKTIGQSPFYHNDKLASVTLPASVTDIKSGFAMNCTALERITVDAGNTAYCDVDGILFNKEKTGLLAYPAAREGSRYVIPAGVTRVGEYAFSYNQKLREVELSDFVSVLGEGAFYSMAKLDAMTVPAAVTEAGSFLFMGSSLKVLDFQASINTTPYSMCSDCSALHTVTFVHSRMKQLYARAFMNCTSLCNVTLPPELEEIYVYAFKGCGRLEALVYPATLKYIQSGAFLETGITVFPDWLSKNGDGDYLQLAVLTYSGNDLYDYAYQVWELLNQERALSGAAPLSMDGDLLEAAMLRASELALRYGHERPDGSGCFSASAKMYGENIAVAQSTPALVMDAWMHSAGHKANILNQEYTSVGIGCFTQGGVLYWVQCFGTNAAVSAPKPSDRRVTVTNAMLADWLTGDHFQFKSRTYDLNEGETVQVCPRLWNMGWSQIVCELDAINFNWVTDNSSVASINSYGLITAKAAGSYTVTGTLKCAPYPALSAPGTVTKEDIKKVGLDDKKSYAKYKVTGKDTITFCGVEGKETKVKIPDKVLINGKTYKVTAVAKEAFKNNKKIVDVSVGKYVKSIGTSAFSGCTKLKTVSVGGSVTAIGDQAFYKCSSLKKLTIPKKVTKIGKKAFYGCKRLKTVTIKTTKLKSAKVGAKAFTGTPKNMTVKVPKTKLSAYKKLLPQKGVSKKAKIKK